MSELTNTHILDDDAITEIEAGSRQDQCLKIVSSAVPNCYCRRPTGHLGAHSESVSPDDMFWIHPAIPALCATVRVLRAENERLKAALEPFTNNGRIFIFHRNVEHGDYFECLFCNREGPRWREIPHNQKCLITIAKEQLK